MEFVILLATLRHPVGILLISFFFPFSLPPRFPVSTGALTYDDALADCGSQGLPRGDTLYYPDGDKMENALFREAMMNLVGLLKYILLPTNRTGNRKRVPTVVPRCLWKSQDKFSLPDGTFERRPPDGTLRLTSVNKFSLKHGMSLECHTNVKKKKSSITLASLKSPVGVARSSPPRTPATPCGSASAGPAAPTAPGAGPAGPRCAAPPPTGRPASPRPAPATAPPPPGPSATGGAPPGAPLRARACAPSAGRPARRATPTGTTSARATPSSPGPASG